MVKKRGRKEKKYNVLAIIAFIFAFLFPPVGLILGIISLVHINRKEERGKGLAIAAVVIGAVLFLLLVIILFVGLIWFAVTSSVNFGGNLSAKCEDTMIVATKVVNTAYNDFSVTLLRQSGEGNIGGVILVFANTEGSQSFVVDIPDPNHEIVMGKPVTVPVRVDRSIEGVSNPSKVSVIVYYLDDEGKEQLCNLANQYTF